MRNLNLFPPFRESLPPFSGERPLFLLLSPKIYLFGTRNDGIVKYENFSLVFDLNSTWLESQPNSHELNQLYELTQVVIALLNQITRHPTWIHSWVWAQTQQWGFTLFLKATNNYIWLCLTLEVFCRSPGGGDAVAMTNGVVGERVKNVEEDDGNVSKDKLWVLCL